MRNFLRDISKFSLWLAGIALVAHLVIPHDHHISESFSDRNNNCPAEKPNEHHNGFPIHCNAFNDLAAEKVVKYNYSGKNQNFLTDFISDSDSHFKIVNAGLKISWLYTEPVPVLILTDLFRLRAPPALT